MALEATDASPADTQAAVTPAQAAHRWDLDLLRIGAILGVVAMHTFGLILSNPELEGTRTWWFGIIMDFGFTFCLPLFVMISGALLLQARAHARGPAAFLRRRAGRLVPALIFWHAFYVVVVRMWILEEDVTPKMALIGVLDARVYTALYFLWLILGLYVLAPVLSAFLVTGDDRRAKIAAVIGIVWASVVWALPSVFAQLGESRPISLGALTRFIPYVGIFIAGYAWRKPRPDSNRWMWALPTAVALLGFVCWQYGNSAEHPWLLAFLPVSYLSVTVMVPTILIFFSVGDLCARWSPPAFMLSALRHLSAATFGVFLTHLVFIAAITRWMPEFYADPAPLAKIQMYLMVVAASFAASLVLLRIPLIRRLV
ncbi:MAG: acyltransferase family protein [Propionibacteriaceae bacterium]|nr:acyltransferase family protein [Propionibacteriaceae bacterium]